MKDIFSKNYFCSCYFQGHLSLHNTLSITLSSIIYVNELFLQREEVLLLISLMFLIFSYCWPLSLFSPLLNTYTYLFVSFFCPLILFTRLFLLEMLLLSVLSVFVHFPTFWFLTTSQFWKILVHILKFRNQKYSVNGFAQNNHIFLNYSCLEKDQVAWLRASWSHWPLPS